MYNTDVEVYFTWYGVLCLSFIKMWKTNTQNTQHHNVFL